MASVCRSASIASAFCGSFATRRLREPQLHRERDELLLRAVVDVPLELLRALVLRGHDPLARSPELLDEPHVAEHEPGLRRDIEHQPLLLGVHRVVRRHLEGDDRGARPRMRRTTP